MTKSKTKKPNLKIAVIIGTLLFFVVIGWYIKSQTVSPKVAEIREPSSLDCQVNIKKISYIEECSESGTFKSAIYTCSNGSTAEKLASSNCISYQDILAEAQSTCGRTCAHNNPSPYPSQSATTKPLDRFSPKPVEPNPSTGPTGSCTEEAGSCIGNSGSCEVYTDGCIKAKLCRQPFTRCQTKASTTPYPARSPLPASSSSPADVIETPNPKPNPSPRKSLIQCFNNCKENRNESFWQCFKSCRLSADKKL